MDANERREAAGKLIEELRAETVDGYAVWPALLARFPDADLQVTLEAAYWIGYRDGESEGEAYPTAQE